MISQIIVTLAAATSPPTLIAPPVSERGYGAVVSIDYHCKIVSSGKQETLVLRESGRQFLLDGLPQEMSGLPIIPYSKFSFIKDESGRFDKWRLIRGKRFAVEEGDLELVDSDGTPKGIVRIDYLYSTQSDRAILLFLPDPKASDAIYTEAGTCRRSRVVSSDSAEVKPKQ